MIYFVGRRDYFERIDSVYACDGWSGHARFRCGAHCEEPPMNKPKSKNTSRNNNPSKTVWMCEAIDAIHQNPTRELTFGIVFAGAGATALTLGVVLIIEAVKS